MSPASNKMLGAGRVISALLVLFLLVDAVGKLLRPLPILEGCSRLGYPESAVLWLGALELLCTALHVVPRTSVLGAILLTGFLGGATASHLRIGDPIFTHTLFPVYFGVLVWLGLFLREDRLRALVPSRS